MKKKHRQLLLYMIDKNQSATSKELAGVLGISPRSVKNYVIEINLLSSKERVLMGLKSGYAINVQAAQELLAQENEQVPQTWEERSIYIIKQLMLEHTTSLDLYSLSEQLYVGYSTLKSDISRMNKAYASFDVQFNCENDCVCIVGEEKKKRRLISYIVQEETSNQLMDISAIKSSFPSIDIDKVSSIIKKTFHQYNYYINDFSNINLLLHFSIMIDRIKDGNRVSTNPTEFTIESAHEEALVTQLCTQLESHFDILLDKEEQFEIYMLFKTNANYSLPNSTDTLREVVGDEILSFCQEVVTKVGEAYYIEIGNEGFLTPFSLHIKNLIVRAQSGRYTKNPMVDTIKTSCPTVYDIAIFVSLELMHHFHLKINEDEVGFLALHIGAEIERQKTNVSKIQCVLLCPDYMQMTSVLYNQLLINFGNQINIIKTASFESEFDDLEYDLILTTVKLSRHHYHPSCTIPPFGGQLNVSAILDALDKFRTSQKNYILKKNFHYFFNDELFYANPQANTRDEVIHMLAEHMQTLDYVNPDFEEKVQIREKAASTAFVNIAVPHSMEMEALKTCVGVVISKKGIIWDSHVVHVVLLVAINKADKQTFRELYEALVMLFSDEQVIELAKECTSFKKFEDMIYSSIIYDMVEQ